MICKASIAKTSALALGLFLATLVLAANKKSAASTASAAEALLPARIRRPAALALTRDGHWLFVANERSGTLSVIDTRTMKVTSEIPAGKSPVDLALTPDDKNLLVVDRLGNELIVYSRTGGELKSPQRLKVAESPITVQVTPDGTRASVASLWSHRLTMVSLTGSLNSAREISLPFAPRSQHFVDGNKVLVAAEFGGTLAVVDLVTGAVDSVRTIPAHNIRSLTRSLDGRRVWLTEQVLNKQGHAQIDDIRWGNLITNNIRSLGVESLLDPRANILAGSELIHLGELDHGTGDPACLVTCGNELAIALAGIGEVVTGPESGDKWTYTLAGKRPVAMLASPDHKRLYVVDAWTDAIIVLYQDTFKVTNQISLGARPELSAAEQGEDLFYDARLSHQGWLSCHSCHTDGHSSGKLADTFSDTTFGTPKRVLSLLGVGETGPWAWNGSMKTLEEQIEKSITATMQGHKPPDSQIWASTAYVKSLKPAPRFDATTQQSGGSRGRELFVRHNCARCHTPPLFTSTATYDVGLKDEMGARTFNPPSLRGVSQGGPFFHDGRAKSLGEVFQKYHHQLKTAPSPQEVSELVAYLRTL